MLTFPLYEWQKASPAQQKALLRRPTCSGSEHLTQSVNTILTDVKNRGDEALFYYSQCFDHITLEHLRLPFPIELPQTSSLTSSFKAALSEAAKNIRCFHQAQAPTTLTIETQTGVLCEQISRPLETIGLYIPGGSAPLFSTVLMVAIPAQLAGCRRLILCSPPPIDAKILYAAHICGVEEIYQLGGAQAIAAMGFGTQSVPKVDKIFGPGNAYVTEAKRQISQSPNGTTIDMPAGPSEVLIIADAQANPAFIAADLLSQAEHGEDSHCLLITPNKALAQAVEAAINQQLPQLSRAEIARKALIQSRFILCADLAQAVTISNYYAPEHLIIHTETPRALLNSIQHAGSIFLGSFSPEVAGDYASGTNHVLPTGGAAKNHSCLGLQDFQKRLYIQELSQKGFKALAPSLEILAAAEGLDAHKAAVTLRLQSLN